GSKSRRRATGAHAGFAPLEGPSLRQHASRAPWPARSDRADAVDERFSVRRRAPRATRATAIGESARRLGKACDERLAGDLGRALPGGGREPTNQQSLTDTLR